MGKGWKLNIQQNLVEYDDGDDESDFEMDYLRGQLSIYIDEAGQRETFVEKYYYLDENDIKQYVEREQCTLDSIADRLFYTRFIDGVEKNETITYEVATDSGYILDTKGSQICYLNEMARTHTDAYKISLRKDESGGIVWGELKYNYFGNYTLYYRQVSGVYEYYLDDEVETFLDEVLDPENPTDPPKPVVLYRIKESDNITVTPYKRTGLDIKTVGEIEVEGGVKLQITYVRTYDNGTAVARDSFYENENIAALEEEKRNVTAALEEIDS
jgi:hypothetical protein